MFGRIGGDTGNGFCLGIQKNNIPSTGFGRILIEALFGETDRIKEDYSVKVRILKRIIGGYVDNIEFFSKKTYSKDLKFLFYVLFSMLIILFWYMSDYLISR